MHAFKDNEGRDWPISINVDSIKRVRALLQVNLLDAVDGKLIEQLDADPILLVDVIYVLCKPTADAANITDEQFGKAMGGDAIDSATVAFLEELTDFFPRGRRQLLKKAAAKLEICRDMALRSANKALDSGKLETAMAKVIAAKERQANAALEKSLLQLCGEVSGNSQASSESTQDPEPTES
jgi:hypothetical protein